MITNDIKSVLKKTGYAAAANQFLPVLREVLSYMPKRPQYKLEQMEQQLQQLPRKRKGRKGRKGQSAVATVPRTLTMRAGAIRPVRIQTTSFLTLTNALANNVGSNLVLDLRTGGGTLGAMNGRLNTLGTLYAQWNLRKIVVTFVPTLSQNSTGTIAMAYEGDPSTAALANIGGIANKRVYAIGSITRDSPTLTWVNPESGAAGNRFCIQTVNAVVKTLDEIGYGMIQFAGANSELNGANVGTLSVETTIDFWEMH